ncbi:hypothetical protein BCR33DRAFT_109750 [Rhizoclosmatium globosum]|uniref:G-protein coupled receptors family 3 profile domain-containing protein n=1 Tax=Rhizoclosmatium globosum TaxID=329046 RepID=A0A1Y2CKB4_9FUNG|nr:hypothetical protein BCR33DRAFT_109750 [Rhizoclosmatium globosum]|eukprot:ORY46775.1 hypothetical protein BCR33DRAFT_109750 [Rhizoclosmatium globosum]
MDPDSYLPHFSRFQYTMAVISTLSLVGLLLFIVYENDDTKNGFRLKFNSFHFLLMAIYGFLAANHFLLGYEASCQELNSFTKTVIYGIEEVCSYGVVYSFLLYSWLRGYDVLRKVGPGWIVKPYRVILILLPIFFTATVCLDIFIYWRIDIDMRLDKDDWIILWDYGLIIINGAVSVLFDTTMLIAFVVYLRRIGSEGESGDTRLKIIARFGVVTSLFAICTFGLDVVINTLNLDTFTYGLLYYLTITCLDIVAGLFLAMKVCLLWDKKVNGVVRISGIAINVKSEGGLTTLSPRTIFKTTVSERRES